MKRYPVRAAAAAFAMLGALSARPEATAECEAGKRPGSTVLYPYFEVDLTRPDGLTTLISLNNAGGTERLVRMVLWTDWALPILAFDVVLPPKDVLTLNLRDLFQGSLPSTVLSPQHGFIACTDQPPSYPTPALSSAELERFRAALTGQGGAHPCLGSPRTDGRARGYITADAVRQCSGVTLRDGLTPLPDTPEVAGYFSTHMVIDNVLWGDLLLVDPGGNSAQGVEAVALLGDYSSRAQRASFYGHFVGWDGRDNRSPLPTRWMARFLNGAAFDGGTDLLVFREARGPSILVNCTQAPDWYPLVAANLIVRGENGAVDVAAGTSVSLPLATQRVRVADLRSSAGPLGPVQPFGQVELDLRTPGGTASPGSWVIPVLTASERFSVGFKASPRDSACGGTP